MNATLLKQQKLNSLRKKDTMWIYKNPQGLLILEDELNERRKKRSARHRSSPPLPHSRPETNQQQQQQKHRDSHEKAVLTQPAMKLESPKDVLIPIAKKAEIEKKPNNIFIEKPLKKSISDKQATPAIEKTDKQTQPAIINKNLIEERSKLFTSSSSSSSISKEISKSTTTAKSTLNLKQTAPQITNKLAPATQDNNFLINAKHKLSSVKQQQKVESSSNNTSEPDSPVPPPRRRGLVSSFVSAFETSSPDILSPLKKGDALITRTNISKPVTLAQIKPTTSQSYNHALPSRLLSNSPPPPIKPRRHSVMPSPTTTVSSPALPTPTPSTFTGVASADSYFPIAAVSPQVIESRDLKLIEPETKISPSQTKIVPLSNEINVYLPQLSPEISFHENADILEDVSGNEEEEEEEDDDDEPSDKEVASILVRPEIKKRVSFSEQLLTYIPEQQSLSDDDITNNTSEPIKSPMLDFSRSLNYELSDVKTKLIAERKVNTTPSRDRFVPAIVKKTEPEVIVPKRPSVANVNAPQKLSNKLLDMFQQKLSKSPIEQQVQVQLSKSQQQSRELVHLTKSRPRKPPSLKKPTYPAATAQPNWRIRATNRKYEFIA